MDVIVDYYKEEYLDDINKVLKEAFNIEKSNFSGEEFKEIVAIVDNKEMEVSSKCSSHPIFQGDNSEATSAQFQGWMKSLGARQCIFITPSSFTAPVSPPHISSVCHHLPEVNHLGSNSSSQDLLRTYMLTYAPCNVLHRRRVGLGLAVGWKLLEYKPLLSYQIHL